MPVPKYITENGVMKKNPLYNAPQPPAKQGNPQASAPLAVVSCVDDVMHASDIQAAKTGLTVPVAASTANTIDMLQEDDMLAKYKSPVPLDGGELLDVLGAKFAHYETPLGLVNKLMMLKDYKLDFLIDNSGSMSQETDVKASDATEPVKSCIRARLGREPISNEPHPDMMTRLEEAEDRLHIMVGFLAYLPIEHIQLRFLHEQQATVFYRTGKTPAQFEDHMHKEIRERFKTVRLLDSTPLAAPLKIGFDYSGKWSHYLFNDGAPNEGGKAIAQQIIHRKNPADHALTLISCTNEDGATAWMKLVDSKAKYVAELDDYSDERDEVVKKQGEAFPYTRGLWLLSQLVASINPEDLDALDENLPLTKYFLDNILGRQLNPNEYQYYFQRNPNAFMYVREYHRFLNQEVSARAIISEPDQEQRELNAGYIEGKRPAGYLANIAAQLDPITQEANQRFAAKFSAQPQQAQMSAATAAPHAAFMPPPPMAIPVPVSTQPVMGQVVTPSPI